jgi:hypothetical protein
MSKQHLDDFTGPAIDLWLVSNELQNCLRQMLQPSKGDLGADYGDAESTKILMEIVWNAFSIKPYGSREKLTDTEIENLIPEIRGAVKIVNALAASGLALPLPIVHQIVVKASRVVRRLIDPGRSKR